METCQRCGTVHEVGARYCPGCGHASASAGEPTQAYAAVGGQQGGAADSGMTWALPSVHEPPHPAGGFGPAAADATRVVPIPVQPGPGATGGFPIPAAEDDPYADLFRPAGGGAPNPNATQVMPAAAPVHQADAQPAYDQPIDYHPGVGRPYSEPYEGPYADDYPPADGEPPRSSRAAKIGIGVAAVAVVVIVVSLITIGGGTPTPAATPGSQQTEVVTPTAPQSTHSAAHGPTGAPTTPPTSASSHAPGVMQLGDQGNDVKWLQNRLKQLGLYNGEVNGMFDQNTQNAVAQFQARTHPSDPSGVVGRSTKTALIAAGSKPRLSVFNPGGDGGGKKGGNPEDIKRLQKALGVALNQNVRVSGTFDVETLGAVMQYQAAVGLGPDGVAGDKVWSALQQGKIVGQ